MSEALTSPGHFFIKKTFYASHTGQFFLLNLQSKMQKVFLYAS